MSKSVEAVEKPLDVFEDTPAERFAQINASNALEGLEASPRLLNIQKSIVSGEIDIATAIRAMRASYGLPDQADETPSKIGPGSRR